MKRGSPRGAASRSKRGAAPPRAARAPVAPVEPLPAAARALVLVLGAALAVLLVSYPLYDPDLWQHLRVGRALWEGLGFPSVNLWTWPTLGAPDLIQSWLYRALLWPFWKWGGVTGTFAWRWLTTLVAFAMLFAAARAGGGDRRGAPTGAAAALALLWCVVVFRYRSQARPETLVAVLLAAQIWALESFRRRGGRGILAVPVIAMLWANAHISYYVGLYVTGAYLLDALLRPSAGRGRRPARDLALVLGASAALSFLNPWGARLLWLPFDFFLHGRKELIYRVIGELAPPDWEVYGPTLLPAFLVLLPALALLRIPRRGPDVAQLLILGMLVPQSLSSQRFLGYLAVAGAPFFARDLTETLAWIRWPAAITRPWPRAAIGALAMGMLAFRPITIAPLEPGLFVRWNMFPVTACDSIASEGIRGRSFNLFDQGGYLLWRFWPDSTRLPFMDIHQTGTRRDRLLYALSLVRPAAWQELDRERRFDWALISRVPHERSPLLDVLDADTTTWALAFVDDAAALYLRRHGANARQAERDRYRWLPGGESRLRAIGARVYTDPVFGREVRAELERAARSSRWNSDALSPLVNIALAEARWSDALALLDRAAAVRTDLPKLWERRGLARLRLGSPVQALEDFERERRADRTWPELHLRRGQALQALGRSAEARAAYERATGVEATATEARDSLATLDRRR